MTNYIPADKLIAGIEKHIKEVKDAAKRFTPNMGFFDAKLSGIYDVMAIIDSLQQEQPEADLVAELKHHLATTSKEQLEKEWKELEPWNNVGPTVQEFLYGKQSEVDLEKYIENEINHYGLSLYEASYGTFSASQIDRIIRNAFELGLNAKKEE